MERLIPNEEHLKEYFNAQGYEVVKLAKPWRHVVGKVAKDNANYFLKLATTEDIGRRTRNEFEWNKTIYNTLPINIPQMFENGTFEGLFWFTGEFVEGEELADPNLPEESSNLENNLPLMAKTAKAILELNPEITPSRDEYEPNLPAQERIIDKMTDYQESTTKDLTPLRGFINERLDYFKIAPQHGDFVPWHFRQTREDKLYLIDSEATSMKGIKFYDIAYFYHRVYTKMKRPDLAERFLDEFKSINPLSTSESACLKATLAQRIAGGYMDAERDDITSIELQDQMKEQLLSDQIV